MASVCSRKRYRVFLPFKRLNLHVLRSGAIGGFLASSTKKNKKQKTAMKESLCEVSYSMLYLFNLSALGTC